MLTGNVVVSAGEQPQAITALKRSQGLLAFASLRPLRFGRLHTTLTSFFVCLILWMCVVELY